MNSLVKYLDCGSLVEASNRSTVEFVVAKFSDIDKKIIPFFTNCHIQGVKSLDFKDFDEVASSRARGAPNI
jgi:hypothetical protein